ncbi:MAG: hypothetical protein VYB55_01655 [Bacteroidota bacterium]|nr:hypothetical protein [Bacteroidota bacterium]MEE2700491.1 hypothetical protein [Bacteroidota bacterium]
MKKTHLFSIAVLLLICFFSCKKEMELTSRKAALHFSNDTILFDTIFTTVGSITHHLKIYNRNDFGVRTNISITGDDADLYAMNVDGITADELSNIEIPANDSIFIFVEVRIDPNGVNTPLITNAEITFNTGGKKQSVDLVAYGQDAYFHTANTFGEIIDGSDTLRFWYHALDCNEVWNNDKPHVIYGYVIIDPGCQFTINEGTQVYLHKNSGILVGNPFSEFAGGTIKVNGTFGNEVVFQGDRLDEWYDNSPGQWDRIWLMPGSIDNTINYAIVKEGSIGIHADTIGNNNPTAIINNTIIEDMTAIGILGQGANLEVSNTIVSNCGQYSVVCNIGGDYNFTHCTFANFWNLGTRNTPSILLNNYYEDSYGNLHIRDLNSANFTNCIIDGGLSTEIEFQENSSGIFNYTFDHSLIKIDPKTNTNTANYINIIKNEDPDFKDTDERDFHLTAESPCVDAGKFTFFLEDIEGNIRSAADLGAFEFTD